MQKGKGGYIMIPLALLFAEDISQEEKVKKLLDHGKPEDIVKQLTSQEKTKMLNKQL